MKKLALILFSLFVVMNLHSQTKSITCNYAPESGYVINFELQYYFYNCDGKVTLIFKNYKATSSSYNYNGKAYTSADIGSAFFNVKNSGLLIGDPSFAADLYMISSTNTEVYIGSFIIKELSPTEAGCVGQTTYNVIDLLNLNNSDYKNKMANLFIKNLKVTQAKSVSYGAESEIRDINKNNEYNDKIKEADALFTQKKYDQALDKYKQALSIKANEEYPKSRIKIIEDLLDKEKNSNAGKNTQTNSNNQNSQGNTSKGNSVESKYNNNTQQNSQSNQQQTNYDAKQKEIEAKIQASKVNYENQLKQSNEIENARQNTYSQLENSLWGPNTGNNQNQKPNNQQSEYELEQQRLMEKKKQEKLEQERIQAAILEKKRKEAEAVANRKNFYENGIPVCSMPDKYKNPNLSVAYYFYIIKTDDKNLKFSSVFPIQKMSDNTWPFKNDIDNKFKTETKAVTYKMLGFYSDMSSASDKRNSLIADAQQAGFSTTEFDFKYKTYSAAEPGQNNKVNKDDFWNK